MIAIISTHPVQYHAPVFRAAASQGLDLEVIYLSDLSVKRFHDPEFGSPVDWATNLLGGYSSQFLRTGDMDAASLHAYPKGLWRRLDAIQPAAIVVLGYTGKLFVSAISHALARSIPLVLRAETTDHALMRHPLKEGIRDAYLRFVYKRTAAFAYVGTRSRQHYLRLGAAADRLFRSPYCVDTSPFDPGEAGRTRLRTPLRTSLGITDSNTVILFSGKLIPRKDPLSLIEAASRAAQADPAFCPCLLFLGDGPLRPEVERIARDRRLPCHVLGFRDQRNLSPAFHAADIFCLPSVTGETWGLVVNEALHHGLPCAITDSVGCAPDLVLPGVTGYIARPHDPDSLAQVLLRVAAMAREPGCRDRCRAHVAGFSVEAAASGLAAACHYATTCQRP